MKNTSEALKQDALRALLIRPVLPSFSWAMIVLYNIVRDDAQPAPLIDDGGSSPLSMTSAWRR